MSSYTTAMHGSAKCSTSVSENSVSGCGHWSELIDENDKTTGRKASEEDGALNCDGIKLADEQTQDQWVQTHCGFYYVPLVWTAMLVKRAKQRRVPYMDDYSMAQLLLELTNLQGRLRSLFDHDWIGLPLAYTQVATFAIHVLFAFSLLSGQLLDRSMEEHGSVLYLPVVTFVELLCYLGLLKVAESLFNPFGEDDDDFETNWLIDRHLGACFAMVNDKFSWQCNFKLSDDAELTWRSQFASKILQISSMFGSAFNIRVPSTSAKPVQAEGQ